LVVEVAVTGSITRAAQRPHLTQPALSHQLRYAEEKLCTPSVSEDESEDGAHPGWAKAAGVASSYFD
jgi:hypothetical protein